MRDKAVAMLTALGVAGAADDPLLDMVLTNVQWRIKNLSNLSEIPEGLESLAVSMAVGEYGNVEEYKSVADAFNEGMSTFDTFQDGWAADAFASGAAWGDGVADKVSGMFDFSALDSMGADSLDAFNLGNDLDSIYGNTGDIANNTAATADALDIAEEDLAYLRDIAEREAINRFTTAEIKVEQHNENHISKDADLDGIMDAWANDFAEKLEVSEEGVHE